MCTGALQRGGVGLLVQLPFKGSDVLSGIVCGEKIGDDFLE